MSFGNLFADPLTFGLGIVVGLAMGAIVAAICLAEPSKHLWIVVLRLSPDLHRRLRRSLRPTKLPYTLKSLPDLKMLSLSGQGSSTSLSGRCYYRRRITVLIGRGTWDCASVLLLPKPGKQMAQGSERKCSLLFSGKPSEGSEQHQAPGVLLP
jgi:hypothetical protein